MKARLGQSGIAGGVLLVILAGVAALLQGCGGTSPATTTRQISISGTVVDTTKSPVAGATVTLGSQTAVTDQNGVFVFPSAILGNYKLTVSGTNIATTSQDVAITSDTTFLGTVVVAKTQVLGSIGANGGASFTITDPDTQQPITVTFPPKSLPAGTTITAAVYGGGAQGPIAQPTDLIVSGITLSANTLALNGTATVSIPVPLPLVTGGQLQVSRFNPTTGQWVTQTTGTVKPSPTRAAVHKTVSFDISQLGTYAVLADVTVSQGPETPAKDTNGNPIIQTLSLPNNPTGTPQKVTVEGLTLKSIIPTEPADFVNEKLTVKIQQAKDMLLGTTVDAWFSYKTTGNERAQVQVERKQQTLTLQLTSLGNLTGAELQAITLNTTWTAVVQYPNFAGFQLVPHEQGGSL